MKNRQKKFAGKIKSINVEFSEKKLTNYSGLVGVGKFISAQKIDKKLKKLFPSIIQNATQYTDSQLLMLVILASFCKIRHFNNIETFSNDVLVKHITGIEKKVSDSNLIDRLKKMGEKLSRKFEDYTLRNARDFMKDLSEHVLTIDTDSTVKTVFGHQEGAAKGYNENNRGAKSYHPNVAFISDYKLVLHTWFRTGNCYTSNGIIDFTKQILAHVPANIKKLFFRMDSGYFNNQLIELLEDNDHDYLIKVKFKNMYQLFKTLDYYPTDTAGVCVSEIDYPFTVCKEDGQKIKIFRTLRVMRKIKHSGIGSMGEQIIEYEYFCYCSNLTNKTTLEIHDIYKKRADCENWIEQLKNHLLGGATLCNDFWANDIMWQLSLFAYNLSVKMRMKIKKFFRLEHNTFRNWFVQLAGLVTSSGRRIQLKLYQYYVFKDRWLEFYQAI